MIAIMTLSAREVRSSARLRRGQRLDSARASDCVLKGTGGATLTPALTRALVVRTDQFLAVLDPLSLSGRKHIEQTLEWSFRIRGGAPHVATTLTTAEGTSRDHVHPIEATTPCRAYRRSRGARRDGGCSHSRCGVRVEPP